MRGKNEWVGGVDGCRGGWFVILCALHLHRAMPVEVRSRLCMNFQGVLDLPERPCVIAVDMPIGLLERAMPGYRFPGSEAA